MFNGRSIAVVVAHPDDAEYSCGGLISRAVSEGNRVKVIVLTNGELAGEHRAKEQEEASKILCNELAFCNMKDGSIKVNGDTVKCIEEQIEGFDIVFAHYPKDTHQDHRNASLITKSASRNKDIVYFEGGSAEDFVCNMYVPLKDSDIAKKIVALRCHKSQTMKYSKAGISFISGAVATSVYRGNQINRKFAEGYCIGRMTEGE